MGAMTSLAEQVGIQPACSALGLSRASYYRWLRPEKKSPDKRRPPLKLTREEADEVLVLAADVN